MQMLANVDAQLKASDDDITDMIEQVRYFQIKNYFNNYNPLKYDFYGRSALVTFKLLLPFCRSCPFSLPFDLFQKRVTFTKG